MNSDKSVDKVRVNLWMMQEQYQRFKELARLEGRSMSDIVRQLVNDYLREQDGWMDKKKRIESQAGGTR